MNLSKKPQIKTAVIYILAFIIPVLVMVIGCAKAKIYPFGERNFLRNDMYSQYLQFFTGMYDKLKSGEGFGYSMQLGLGSGTAAVYAYYLACPLNLLMVLVPRVYITEFMTALIICKMGLAGLSFAYYLRKRFDKVELGILFFSCAYALSGYMAAYQWNIMWLDVIVLAPLVLRALEELVEEGKGTKYCILLAFSIFTNMYLSIMLCIFLVLYFVTLVIWKPWSVKWRAGLKFGGYSLIAGGMAACLLVPAYFAMSSTGRTSTAFPDKIEWYMNFLEMMARHCMKVPMEMSDKHWPHLYCGAAALLLLALYAFNRNISIKERAGKMALIAVFWLSFMCNVLDFAWHGLNFPNSLPAREAYLYIWLVLVMGYEVYLNLKDIRIWELIVSGVLCYGVIAAAGVHMEVANADTWSYGLTLGIIRVYFAIIAAYCICRIPQMQEYLEGQRWFALLKKYQVVLKVIVLILVVTELSCNMFETSIRTSNRTNYNKFYAEREGAVSWLKENDTGLYRTEIFERKTKNDGLMWNINSATFFSSSVNSGIRAFYEALGMSSGTASHSTEGATPLISAMLGVKYMLGNDGSMENDFYELVYSDSSGYLYQCNYTLPMGYVVDSGLDEAWNLSDYNPVKAQNDLCHLLGIEEDLLVPVESVKVNDQKYTITAKEEAYIYVYLGKHSVSDVKATINGSSRKYTQAGFDYLIDVGTLKAGETATVEAVDTDKKFKTFEAYKLNLDVLSRVMDELGRETLDITKHEEGYLQGTVTLAEEGSLVISIPVEKGWKLLVDGEETELQSFEDIFLAVNLPEGTHNIVLEYQTPGLGVGMMVSVVAVAVFVVCVILERRKRSILYHPHVTVCVDN